MKSDPNAPPGPQLSVFAAEMATQPCSPRRPEGDMDGDDACGAPPWVAYGALASAPGPQRSNLRPQVPVLRQAELWPRGPGVPRLARGRVPRPRAEQQHRARGARRPGHRLRTSSR
eukprot:13244081-Alexandrium_andersonii.AAC.1